MGCTCMTKHSVENQDIVNKDLNRSIAWITARKKVGPSYTEGAYMHRRPMEQLRSYTNDNTKN